MVIRSITTEHTITMPHNIVLTVCVLENNFTTNKFSDVASLINYSIVHQVDVAVYGNAYVPAN